MAKKILYANPYDENFNLLTADERYRNYELLLKATNQRLRTLEKKNVHNISNVYVSLREQDIKTKSGNVGFTKIFNEKNYKGISKSTFTKEYKRIWNAYTSQTITENGVKEAQAEVLAQFGIDVDEISDKDVENMTDFWNLYTRLERLGVFAEFGLKSDEAQDVVHKYVKKYGAPKGYKQVAKSVRNHMDEAKKVVSGELPDVTKYKYFDNLKRLKSASARLSVMLAQKNWGTKPVLRNNINKRSYL